MQITIGAESFLIFFEFAISKESATFALQKK